MELLLACLFLICFTLLLFERVKVAKWRKMSYKKECTIQILHEDLERQDDLAYSYEMEAAQLQREINQFCKESGAARRFWRKVAKRRVKY